MSPRLSRRTVLFATTAMAAVTTLLPRLALAQAAGGTITVATIGEPPTLDPMASTADLVGMITQHIFETLYTFDSGWNPTPLLAQSLPAISEDGKTYTIALREGVTFHDGTEMSSEDVVASLNRWMAVATRGKQAAGVVSAVEAVDPLTVRISLETPYAPLVSLLAFNNSAAIILPAEKQADPLTEFVGTGPYLLTERRADQYIQLSRFDGYKSRDGEPDGYGGGRRQYLDEIRFVPVPDANTRIEAAISGQFDYVDSIPVESFGRVASSSASEPLMLKPAGWPVFVLNSGTGKTTSLPLRKAIRTALSTEDMMAAAFGSTDFFEIDAALYPPPFSWNTDAGTEGTYNVADPAAAAALLAEAGYDGSPLRILTSRQYEFHYKMAQVAAEYLKLAGFTVELDVVDWATLTQRRADPALWDIYITHSPFLPEPALIGMLSTSAPGNWDTPARAAAVDAFNAESDPAQRAVLWAEVQKVIYEEGPFIKIGNFNSLAVISKKLGGVSAAPWPYFWNASIG